MLLLRVLKWLFGALLGIAILIALAVVIVPRVVDPNDYRDKITDLVQQQTGRQMQLNGDLSVSVFPWLGIRTQGVSLSQPEGIAGDMIEVATAQLRVKLLPLLSKRVEVDTVVLEQPQLRFVTLQNGINSLSGLVDSSTAQDGDNNASQNASPEAALALVIQGLELSDGRLEWDNRQAQQRYQVSDLQLMTGNLIGDELAAIELSGSLMDLSGVASGAATSTTLPPLTFKLTGQAQIDTESLFVNARSLHADIDYADYRLDFELDSLEFDSSKSLLNASQAAIDFGANMAGQEAQVSSSFASLSVDQSTTQISLEDLAAEMDYAGQEIALKVPRVISNIDRQTASIPVLEFVSEDVTASVTELAVSDFIDKLVAKGSIDVPSFDMANQLDNRDIDYVLSDASALTAVSLKADFVVGLDQLALSGMTLALDETRLQGDFSAKNFSALALQFDLILDHINLDRYMPKDESSDSAREPNPAGGANALTLPMALFKDINANGQFKADSLVSAGVTLTEIDVLIESSPGRVSVTPRADLYDGELTGSMVFVEQDGAAELRVKNTIGVVDLAKFFTAADVTDQLSGLGEVELDVLVTERDGVQRNEGTIKLWANNGAFKGIDIKRIVDQAYTTYQQLSGDERDNTATESGRSEQSDETGFTELVGTFVLNDFTLSNNDFQINAPFFRISGSGDIDLAQQSLDYLLNISIVDSAAGQGGASLEDLQGVPLPLRLNGALTAPNYSLDLKAMYNAVARAKVNEKKAEYLHDEYGIDGGENLSTKEVLKALLRKEMVDDDESLETEPSVPAAQPVDPQQPEAEVQPADETLVLDNQPPVAEEPVLSKEEQQQQAKDDLEEDLKLKILESIFD